MMHSRTHSKFTRRALVRGFTLIEVMITLAVAMVLLILALPSFRETAIRNNVKQINNTLIYSLNLARTEAVRRGTQVEVINLSGTADWSGGWQIVANVGFANPPFSSATASAVVITNQAAVPTTYTVCGISTPAGTNDRVVFTPTGILNGVNAFDMNINRPDSKPTLSQRVTIQNGGLVRNRIDTTGSPASANSTCS
jgi:type IV fimbrial biogenesis protein FimT